MPDETTHIGKPNRYNTSSSSFADATAQQASPENRQPPIKKTRIPLVVLLNPDDRTKEFLGMKPSLEHAIDMIITKE